MVRSRAAQLLGSQDVPEAVEPLLDLAVRDPDPGVREVARTSAAKLVNQRPTLVAHLLSELESSDALAQRNALEALSVLPLAGIPLSLRARVLARVSG